MSQTAPSPGHLPVLPEQVVEVLHPQPGDTVVDCTCGPGGHSLLLGQQLQDRGRLVCVDLDPRAIEAARARLASLPIQLDMVHGNYADLDRILGDAGIEQADVILADLGVSSVQLEDPARGLSFQVDGPLDMRIDPEHTRTTAADLVNSLDEPALADLLYNLGDERFSRKIARAIHQARHGGRITTTAQLAWIVARAVGVDPQRRGGRIHPATRTFLALRMAVNREREHLEAFLGKVPSLLRVGGRVGVVSFHSGEDRLIKVNFQRGRERGHYEILTRKPITPIGDEVRRNPRCRSAKLRAARRI